MCFFAGLGLDCLARQVVWIDNKLVVEWWWLKGHAVDKRTGRMDGADTCKICICGSLFEQFGTHFWSMCLWRNFTACSNHNIIPFLAGMCLIATSQPPHSMYKLLRRPLRAFVHTADLPGFSNFAFWTTAQKSAFQKLSGRIWGLHSPILPFHPKDDHSLDSRWCLFTSHADLPTFFPTFAGKVGESSTNWNATHFGDLEEHLIGMERGWKGHKATIRKFQIVKTCSLMKFPPSPSCTADNHSAYSSTHCLRVLQQKHMIKIHVRPYFSSGPRWCQELKYSLPASPDTLQQVRSVLDWLKAEGNGMALSHYLVPQWMLVGFETCPLKDAFVHDHSFCVMGKSPCYLQSLWSKARARCFSSTHRCVISRGLLIDIQILLKRPQVCMCTLGVLVSCCMVAWSLSPSKKEGVSWKIMMTWGVVLFDGQGVTAWFLRVTQLADICQCMPCWRMTCQVNLGVSRDAGLVHPSRRKQQLRMFGWGSVQWNS